MVAVAIGVSYYIYIGRFIMELHACRPGFIMELLSTYHFLQRVFGSLPMKKSLERFCKSGIIGRDDINS